MQFCSASLENWCKWSVFTRSISCLFEPVATIFYQSSSKWFSSVFVFKKTKPQPVWFIFFSSVWSSFDLFPVLWTGPSNTRKIYLELKMHLHLELLLTLSLPVDIHCRCLHHWCWCCHCCWFYHCCCHYHCGWCCCCCHWAVVVDDHDHVVVCCITSVELKTYKIKIWKQAQK